MAMFLSLKSNKNLRTNSSTKLLLPAPPVPVIPKTGVFNFFASWVIPARSDLFSFGKFSAADITRAIDILFIRRKDSCSSVRFWPVGKSDVFTK